MAEKTACTSDVAAATDGSDRVLDAEQAFAEAVDPAVLLAPLLGAGARSLGRARRLLARIDLDELARSSDAHLVAHGLSQAAARRVVGSFALSRAWLRARAPARPCLRSPSAVHTLLRAELATLRRERFWTLSLDGRHRLLRAREVSTGTLTSSLVHPREVFAEAIRDSAAAILVAHNHPSGDPEPSEEDLEVTRRLARAGELLGIPLLDHVVLTKRTYLSLRERHADVFPASSAPGAPGTTRESVPRRAMRLVYSGRAMP